MSSDSTVDTCAVSFGRKDVKLSIPNRRIHLAYLFDVDRRLSGSDTEDLSEYNMIVALALHLERA